MSYLPKLMQKIFFHIFQQFFNFLIYIRALFFQICHQNGYWMCLTYILFYFILFLSKKDLFSFLFFGCFFQILEDISNSSVFGQYVYIIFLQFLLRIKFFGLCQLFGTIFRKKHNKPNKNMLSSMGVVYFCCIH